MSLEHPLHVDLHPSVRSLQACSQHYNLAEYNSRQNIRTKGVAPVSQAHLSDSIWSSSTAVLLISALDGGLE